MSEWQGVTLGELVRFRAGTGFPKDLQGSSNGSLPFAKVSDMNSAGNELTLSFAENYLSEEQAKSLRAYIHRPGAVAFAKIGVALTTNRRRRITCPLLLDNNMMSAEPDEKKIDAKFAYYLFLTLDFNVISSGSALPFLTIGSLKDIPISLPPLRDQREIAAILGALDDKIELNRKTAATLEEMARALYRSWFVDFDPVRAKTEGRSPAHMDPETAALFPDSFGDDGLPVGWKFTPLLEIIELLSGGTPKTDTPEYWGGDIKWASAKDVSQCGQLFLTETERTITQAGLERSSTKVIPKFSTVVVARGATTGRACMFGADIAMNQTCYGLRSRCDQPFFANCMFMTEVLGITLAAHGSVFDTITTKTLQSASVVLPTPPLCSAFENVVSSMFERILVLTGENQTLATLRDTLLPRLMSGDLRVGEAREQMEDIV